MKRFFLIIIIVFASLIFIDGCSDEEEEETCPGVICHDCSASGDCPDLDCPEGQIQYCGGYDYLDDPDLRCTYCGPE